MPSYRFQHTVENIKREIISIIRELNDPRVKDNFFDIVKADMTRDMSMCNIYISSINGFDKAKESSEGLNSAASYIKRELAARLAKSLKPRHIPSIKFIPTDSVEYGINMTAKINNICKSEGEI